VLVEGDDMNDPVADAARAILDGHIVLSRKLATSGHFPSIDVLESVSRVAPRIMPAEQIGQANELRRLMAAYRDAKDLIEIGAYVKGTNPVVDRAVQLKAAIDHFLRQSAATVAPISQSLTALATLVAP
jgi:flagellum-specific ATP synthase